MFIFFQTYFSTVCPALKISIRHHIATRNRTVQILALCYFQTERLLFIRINRSKNILINEKPQKFTFSRNIKKGKLDSQIYTLKNLDSWRKKNYSVPPENFPRNCSSHMSKVYKQLFQSQPQPELLLKLQGEKKMHTIIQIFSFYQRWSCELHSFSESHD